MCLFYNCSGIYPSRVSSKVDIKTSLRFKCRFILQISRVFVRFFFNVNRVGKRWNAVYFKSNRRGFDNHEKNRLRTLRDSDNHS